MFLMNKSVYTNKKFSDIYPDITRFLSDYENIGLPKKIKDDNIRTLYFLLLGNYANSPIAYSDVQQFKVQLFSIVWQFGPQWERKIEIQDRLRSLDESELREGSRAIYNRSLNPDTIPSTSALEELPTINEQNTTNYKKSKVESYQALWEILHADITTPFLNKFKNLFYKFISGECPILYENECEV